MKSRSYADVLQYLEDMRDFACKAREYSRGRTISDLRNDEPYRFSILYPLQIVGEAASHVPPSVRDLAPTIPWKLVVGFRHVVVHGYGAVRIETVQSILDEELAPLLSELDELIRTVSELGEAPLP